MSKNISIIIPIKEQTNELIKKKLDLLLKDSQNLIDNNIEIIVIDGGSPKEVIDYLMQDYRYTLQIAPENIARIDQNQSILRNTGSKMSNAKYLCFSDCDVRFNVDSLIELYKKIEQKNADIIMGKILTNTEQAFFLEYYGWTQCVTCFELIRRNFFNRIRGFDERFAGHYGFEDVELFERAKRNNAKIELIGEVISYMNRIDKGSHGLADTKVNWALLQSILKEQK